MTTDSVTDALDELLAHAPGDLAVQSLVSRAAQEHRELLEREQAYLARIFTLLRDRAAVEEKRGWEAESSDG